MNDDVRRTIYATIIGFLAIVVTWLGFIYISSCGFTLNCYQARPLVIRTPIPTLIPVSHAETGGAENEGSMGELNRCRVAATDLIGAWVAAGNPEADAFPFMDIQGNPCEGTFDDDVQHLFVDNNLWEPDALGCVSCHNAELTERSGGLDLSSYAAITESGILGDGEWESSTLHSILLDQGLVPAGHSPDESSPGPVILYAGQAVEEDPEVTPTATP
jgi:hypothetical protein